ncbi:hypothetical protein NP233_g2076 [Leucocoprinus birnbaumii]|uniref:NACHT domain-containing protein n=1 Tax=Leucocoprinus birnbaumii TaxID=56174 RepID=A0AAD5YXI2_9AGAR|nr:hypothetical protein NP233_g2076 [Leucocoprinus birnbaumii]
MGSRSSGAGFFNNAHHFTINQPTMILNADPDSVCEGSSMKLLLQNAISGTSYDASERYPPPSCHPQTRSDICGHIQFWAHDSSRGQNMLWLHGPAGVGKSAIMQTIAETEAEPSGSILGGTIFFSRRNGRNDLRHVFTTLAYQLAVKYPIYRRYIVQQLSNDPRLIEKSLTEQFKCFFTRPFTQGNFLEENTILILLDGLDECSSEASQRELITLISRFVLNNPVAPLIWIIASRPEFHIQRAFSDPKIQNSHQRLAVPLNTTQACLDVERYLRDKFDDIRLTYADCFSPTTQQWPPESDFLQIVSRACGLFIFASTIVRFIEDENVGNPVSQLRLVMRAIQTVPSIDPENSPLAALDSLYAEIISSLPPHYLPIVKGLLSLALVRYAPFGVACNWLGLTQADSYSALRKLQSVLSIPSPKAVSCDAHVGLFHTSFLDYLLSPSRSSGLLIEDREAWEDVFLAMTNVLRQSYNPADSSIDISRIVVSWPYREKTIDVQKELFEVSLRWFFLFSDETRHLEVYLDSEIGGFLEALDYGSLEALLPRNSDAGRICYAACTSPVYRALQSRNIVRKTTVRSLNLNCLRPSKPASGQILRRYERSPTVCEPISTILVLEGFEEITGPTSEDRYWKTRILQHLFLIMDMEPSPEVFLIGKGSPLDLRIISYPEQMCLQKCPRAQCKHPEKLCKEKWQSITTWGQNFRGTCAQIEAMLRSSTVGATTEFTLTKENQAIAASVFPLVDILEQNLSLRRPSIIAKLKAVSKEIKEKWKSGLPPKPSTAEVDYMHKTWQEFHEILTPLRRNTRNVGSSMKIDPPVVRNEYRTLRSYVDIRKLGLPDPNMPDYSRPHTNSPPLSLPPF